MIWESGYWKDELLRQAKALRGRMTQERWPQASFAKVEQSLMFSFYAVRKLAEARKLSDKIMSRTLPIVKYASTGKPVHHLNWQDIEQLYDFPGASKANIALLDLCNHFVHSYVFQLNFEEDGGLNGVFVTSERKRRSYLYLVGIRQIIGLFEKIGRDYPSSWMGSYDEGKGDYKIKQA